MNITPMTLTAVDAARALNISPKTLWTLTARGEIAVVKIGRRVLYRPSDLQAFVDGNCASVTAARKEAA
jgi:excisionase family DNA binding protein